jgi:hypothetical protein
LAKTKAEAQAAQLVNERVSSTQAEESLKKKIKATTSDDM